MIEHIGEDKRWATEEPTKEVTNEDIINAIYKLSIEQKKRHDSINDDLGIIFLFVFFTLIMSCG